MATKGKDVIDTATDGLNDQIESLRRDLTNLTQTVTDFGKTKGDEVVSAAKSKISDARDIAIDQAETGALHAMEVQDQTIEFIRKQPMTALGLAAGVGILTGLLLARRD